MSASIDPEFFPLQQILAGRFSIEGELGRGGMGIVLLARDVALDRLVAIKILPPLLAVQPAARERFLQEARTAAGLSHPNIVPIHLVEERGDWVFFVMGYVDGETLRQRVERVGPLSQRLATHLLQEVSWALAYAHQRGVIHRDIKPDNIMIEHDTERAMVTDFGIAIGAHEDPTLSGEVIGTARYMSPEQACGDAVDARSDLYSLGATLFYAVTGRAPFEGHNLPAILARQVTEAAPGVRLIRPEISEHFAATIARCLQKSPADRFQSGDELARLAGDLRGNEFRAPPLLRSFVRNAQVTTMALLITGLGGGDSGRHGTSVSLAGILAGVLILQLGLVARRLLREGYAFADIRTALLAEAAVQEEEAEVVGQRRWTRRIATIWHKLWAGPVGRNFFLVAGLGLQRDTRSVLKTTDATELILGHSVRRAYDALPGDVRQNIGDVTGVVDDLEVAAERLRARGDTGQQLVATVAALENLRLSLLRLQGGAGTLDDLTVQIARAREIGAAVDRRLAADAEVRKVLGEE